MPGNLFGREVRKIVLVHTGEEVIDDLDVNAGTEVLNRFFILFSSHAVGAVGDRACLLALTKDGWS